MSIFKKNNPLLLAILISLVLNLTKITFAQNIILNDLAGKPVDISSYKGKPVILFFWTSWCYYCRKQLKILSQNQGELKKDGITILAINIGESNYKVQSFFNFKTSELSFKVLLDEQGDFADSYDVIGVPTYILLDKTGKKVSQENTFPQDYKSLLGVKLKE